MVVPLRSIALCSALAVTVHAIPTRTVQARQAITTLTSGEVSAFRPYSHYASTAYCNPSTTINWSCGTNCQANPGFIPTASGGDGSDVQFCGSKLELNCYIFDSEILPTGYVGYDPTLSTVIVAHQGTDPSKL